MTLKDTVSKCSGVEHIYLYIDGQFYGKDKLESVFNFYNETLLNSEVVSISTVNNELGSIIIKAETENKSKEKEKEFVKTKLIIGERGSGKTARLIKKAAEEQLYILVTNKARARYVFSMAHEMGLNIPNPVTITDFYRSAKFRGSSIRRDGLLIDDLGDFLDYIFDAIPIHEMTFTDDGENVVEL